VLLGAIFLNALAHGKLSQSIYGMGQADRWRDIFKTLAMSDDEMGV